MIDDIIFDIAFMVEVGFTTSSGGTPLNGYFANDAYFTIPAAPAGGGVSISRIINGS